MFLCCLDGYVGFQCLLREIIPYTYEIQHGRGSKKLFLKHTFFFYWTAPGLSTETSNDLDYDPYVLMSFQN